MKNIKTNFKFIHISYEEFTPNRFQSEILKHFKLNTTYSILLKISSTNYLNFKMCGPQIGIVIGNEHNLDFYLKLYNLIQIRIENIVDMYDYLDTINGLELMYSVIIPQKELTLKNISNYTLNHPLINKKEIKKVFNQNLLPLTLDKSYYGYTMLSEERQQ
jgi:hypothetical protein